MTDEDKEWLPSVACPREMREGICPRDCYKCSCTVKERVLCEQRVMATNES